MLKALWAVLLFLLAWILSVYFGIPLHSLVKPVFALLPGIAWLAIALGLLSGFLLLLLEGSRRFYVRTISEIFVTVGKAVADYEFQSRRIEKLALFEGQSQSMYHLLENRTSSGSEGPPLKGSEIQYHEGLFWNTVQDYYGADYLETYFSNMAPASDDLRSQRSNAKSLFDVRPVY